MSDAKWWLICYDVRDDKRLRKAAKLLEGNGQRVQYSVFRCWLSRRQMEKLRWELTEILEAEDDTLFIPLCSRCVKHISATHSAVKKPDWPDEPKSFAIV